MSDRSYLEEKKFIFAYDLDDTVHRGQIGMATVVFLSVMAGAEVTYHLG